MDGVRRPSYQVFPRLLMLEITTRCNMNCDYCIRSALRLKGSDMPWERFQAINENTKSVENLVFCGIGETLLHLRFYDMISAAADRKVMVITNGTVPIDYGRLLRHGNIVVATFSIDGPTEELARKSCPNYDYRRLLDNLNRGASHPGLSKGINCVLGPDNVDSLPEMVEFAADYGVDTINFILPTYNRQWVTEQISGINDAFRAASEVASARGVRMIDPYSAQCVYEGAVIPVVSISGAVRPCCQHFGEIPEVGNVLTATFDDVWAGVAYEGFRSGRFCRNCRQYHNSCLPRHLEKGVAT